jgi:rubrerythrin
MPEGSERIQEPVEQDEYVAFLLTGQPAAGEFHCSQCGYGVVVQLQLPRCPMCSGTAWEKTVVGAIRRRPTGRLQ